MTACDQVIEQTLNRDSKTKGGLKGMSLNKQAVSRWVVSHAACDAITGKFLELAGQRNANSSCNNLSQTKKKLMRMLLTI